VKNAELACILWSIDTRDWSNRNKKTIVKIVKKEVKNGSIILFHDRISATLEAIDELIPWLQEQGYDLVTVTELLESAAPIEYGKSYRQKPAK
jgi:peptidoglycan/xylan/chitin deacetylase (PgdA/CDA1 family)